MPQLSSFAKLEAAEGVKTSRATGILINSMEVRTQGPVSLAQPRAPKVACQNLVTQEAPGWISIRIGCNGCSVLFEVGRAAQQWCQQVAEPSFGAILRYYTAGAKVHISHVWIWTLW